MNHRIGEEYIFGMKLSNLLLRKQRFMHDLFTGKMPVNIEEHEVVCA